VSTDHPGNKWLGKYVTVYAGYDHSKTRAPMAEGKVLGYLADPSIHIEHPDGSRSTWQVTMPIDVRDEAPERHEMQVHGNRAECTCGWWISDLTNAWAVSSAAAHVDAFVEREMVEADKRTTSP